MPGAILQLVANTGPQNQWIEHNPQITWFKKVFRRHTPFSKELIPLQFNSTFDFGKTATATILRKGDLVHRAFVAFDLPELAAVFPNPKSDDLVNLIMTSNFTDKNFSDKLKKYINNGSPEISQILNTIDETLAEYNTEQERRINILAEMNTYRNRIDPEKTTIVYPVENLDYLDKESFGSINKIYAKKIPSVSTEPEGSLNKGANPTMFTNLVDLKMEIAKRWLYHKKEYLPLYELIKFIYLSQYNLVKEIPLVGTNNINRDLIIPYIFTELLPSPDIFMIHHNKIHPEADIVVACNNFEKYLKKYNRRSLTLNNMVSHSFCDMAKINYNNWDDFGEPFYDMLNTYNAIINVLKMLGKTIPIVITKAFSLEDPNANIYTDLHATPIHKRVYPTIIDPNFQRSFINNITNIDNATDTNIIPIDYNSTYDQIYPNNHTNGYLKLFNHQASSFFNNIRTSMEKVFETYRNNIFSSTDKLFFRNAPPLTNIYSYFSPKIGYQDSAPYRPRNVMNTNVFFLYFFKYMDMLNANSIAEYLNQKAILSIPTLQFLVNLVSLIKINISYYMNEISYLMNDLYAKSPSSNPFDTMKNYTPEAYAPVINGYNIHTDLLAVTIIFHRNHTPSILEIFQFIYYFIDRITLEQINEYLNISMEATPNEAIISKNIAKMFYQEIFKYFMDIYDSFGFEEPANIGNQEKLDTLISKTDTENISFMIKNYLQYFLLGKGSPIPNQPTIAPFAPQMEFYFVSEMINMRETQKFYYNLLQNTKLISGFVGGTTLHLLDLIIKYLQDLDSGYIPHTQNVQEYWDDIYQHNIRAMKADKLYYTTFSLDRYNGESYLQTPYTSRFYGKIGCPIDNPLMAPSIPYGVNPSYYDNNNINYILDDEIPIYWTENQNMQISNKPSTDRPNHVETSKLFRMYTIDFFRIKHEIFHLASNPIDTNLRFIDEYQFNILQFVRLAEQLNNRLSPYILHWLKEALQYLSKYTDPNVNYISKDGIEKNISGLLNIFLGEIEDSIYSADNISQNKNLFLSKEIILDMIETSEQMMYLFDQELPLQINIQAEPYNHKMLIDNNNYIFNHVLNSHFTNIIYALTLLRDNFISQYFYYQKHRDNIKNLENNNFQVTSITNYVKNILNDGSINNMALLYPSIFRKDILKIYSNNDDFKSSIIEFLYPLAENANIKLSLEDITNLINMVYTITAVLYNYLLENNIYNYVFSKLSYYQPMMLSKLSMINEIEKALGNKNSTMEKLQEAIRIAEIYGINGDDFRSFIKNSILTKKTKFDILSDLHNGLDRFFLDKNFKSHKNTFKDQILYELEEKDNVDRIRIGEYLKWIDNNLLPYVHFYLEFAYSNKLNTLENPLDITKFNTIDNVGSNVSDGLEFIMDNLLDQIIGISKDMPDNGIHFDYGSYFSIISKNIYNKCNNDNNDTLNNITACLGKTADPKVFGELISKLKTSSYPNDQYIESLSKISKIVELNKDMASKGILQLEQQLKELVNLRKQISDILYRNVNAHSAWIRKLGHYLVKSASIQCGNETIDLHISDWFEVFNQIFQKAGLSDGYDKMIGHREDLINFDTKPKKSYKIILPLVFYWNKYVTHSIPLAASTHTQYEIKIELRDLSDVAYKDQFSEYINLLNGKIEIPKLSNAQLMIEYIYLSKEERKIFFGKHLEYLIDELQYELDVGINDNNLAPIYKISNGKNEKKGIYLDKNELSKYDEPKLLSRKDYKLKIYKNRNGIIQWAMVTEPLSIDPYIHYKRLIHRYHFNNPTKMLSVLVRPLIHIDPLLRKDNKNYFYGEKQWDNYGLYSYYDLSHINKTKEKYYNDLRNRLNDIDDPEFGIINVINQLLLNYQDKPEILEKLQQIKDTYLEYYGPIYDNTNIVHTKHQLYMLNINYEICDLEEFYEMVLEICKRLSVSFPTIAQIKNVFNKILKSINSCNITKDDFRNIVINLLAKYIDSNILSQTKVETIINSVYKKYNHQQIDNILNEMDKYGSLNNFTKGLKYFLQWYIESLRNTDNKNIKSLNAAIKILDHLEKSNPNGKIYSKNITLKDIIGQMNNINSGDLDMLTNIINNKLNEIINEHYVNIIEYNDYLIENPKINPIISANFTFNTVPIMPENTDNKILTEIPAYIHFNSTPSTGINTHSWALKPLSPQPTGSVNLGEISDFTAIYNIHPLIGNNYPATMTTMVLSINMVRYLAGMCGKSW